MTAAKSLLASAEAFETVGDIEAARQCRLWATHAEFCPFGGALYVNYASQAATRATRRLHEFHMSQEAGGQPNKRAGVSR